VWVTNVSELKSVRRAGDQLLDELTLRLVRQADVGREDGQVVRELVEQSLHVPHVAVVCAKLTGAASHGRKCELDEGGSGHRALAQDSRRPHRPDPLGLALLTIIRFRMA
jgi:hypothetical protein